LLRKWRQRYSFTPPIAATSGKVTYSRQTVDRLRLIKRLLDCGFGPAKIVGTPPHGLARLNQSVCGEPHTAPNESIRKLMERVRHVDFAGVEALLVTARNRGTLADFVVNTVAPLLDALGDAWSRKELEIFHEHWCAAIILRRLHIEIDLCKQKPGYPRVLLATLPEEMHTMGQLMTEAVPADQGANTVSTGSHMPINEMAVAAAAFGVDVLALSISFACPKRRVRPALLRLRRLLPPRVQPWVGGAGVGGEIITGPPKGTAHIF